MSSRWKNVAVACALLAGCEHEAHGREADEQDAGAVEAAAPSADASESVLQDASRAGEASTPAATDAGLDGGAVPPWRALHPSFEQALRVEVDGVPAIVDEQSADQVDYFVFHGRAGSYYEIRTDRGEFAPDNTIELFDTKRRKLAANDDGSRFPGDDIDARLVVRLPADGDYYVRAEDLQTPAEFFAGPLPLLYYHLTVEELSDSTEGYARWSEQATLPFVEDITYGYRYLTVTGELGGSGAKLTLQSPVANALIARIHPGGVTGDGSSVSMGAVRVTSQGQPVSEIQRTKHEDFHPPVAAGTVEVSIEAPAPLGDNPFYAVDLVLLKDNPSEQAEPNHSAESAETVTLSRGSTGRGLLLSRLPAGDVDLWRIPVLSASQIIFSCEAERGGSGLRGLRAELLDAQLAPLTDASEGDQGLDATYAGTLKGPLFLRLHGEGGAAQLDPWVRCVVIAG
jgi:Bacterial pre-peptidase C-terminal domain